MPLSKYEVHKAWVVEADFEILVLKIPEGELEDKLAYLAREKGVIQKSLYEDFVIATCIANINQLLSHIRQQMSSPPDLMKIREEVMGEILKVNPPIDPVNLIINRNHVVKLKTGKTLEDGAKLLTDNKSWDVSYYDDQQTQASDNKNSLPEEMKDIENLEMTVVKQWWKRINQYIEIKKFLEKDMESILTQKCFHNRTSFQTFIVSLCVINSEELFVMLDSMGIPSRVSPPILMHEVYDLCKAVNPFLLYENAQELSDEELDEDQTSTDHGHTKSNQASMVGQSKKQKQRKKLKFKNVSKKDLLCLGDSMKVSLVGQDEAIEEIVSTIQRASVGLKDPVKPIGSFLFAGKTGCGKTLSAKVLADGLIKERNNLITIDCSEYSSDHEYSKLIGAPAGYIGYDQGGYLTNAVVEHPFSVVVFDEIEKASSKVHELLLQVMDEGRLTDGKGKSVSFKNTVIIMTSNVGIKEINDVKSTIGFGNVAELTDMKQSKAITIAIKNKFKPEFINRIDSIVNFKQLTKKDYMRIIDIELYKLNDNLRSNATEYKDCELTFDTKVKGFIFKKGINEQYGARPLKRCIEKEVSTPLARELLKDVIVADSKIKVGIDKGKISFDIKNIIKESPLGGLSLDNGKETLSDLKQMNKS